MMQRMATKKKSPLLAVLPPEPFGRKLCRAREDMAHMKLDEVAERISQWVAVSTATLSRLEHEDAPPSKGNPQIIATLAAVACGLDPAELGLSLDSLPSAWNRESVLQSLASASRWTTDFPWSEQVPA
jgi:hypothetical protein